MQIWAAASQMLEEEQLDTNIFDGEGQLASFEAFLKEENSSIGEALFVLWLGSSDSLYENKQQYCILWSDWVSTEWGPEN